MTNAKPSSKPISDRALARALGVSLSTFQAARATGRIPSDERDPERLRAAWVATSGTQGTAPLALRGEATTLDGEEGGNLAEYRLRREKWASRKLELEVRAAARELVPAADVVREVEAAFVACKTHLLALPNRMRQQLPHLTVSDVEVIEACVREALEHLASRADEAPTPQSNPQP